MRTLVIDKRIIVNYINGNCWNHGKNINNKFGKHKKKESVGCRGSQIKEKRRKEKSSNKISNVLLTRSPKLYINIRVSLRSDFGSKCRSRTVDEGFDHLSKIGFIIKNL